MSYHGDLCADVPPTGLTDTWRIGHQRETTGMVHFFAAGTTTSICQIAGIALRKPVLLWPVICRRCLRSLRGKTYRRVAHRSQYIVTLTIGESPAQRIKSFLDILEALGPLPVLPLRGDRIGDGIVALAVEVYGVVPDFSFLPGWQSTTAN